MAKHVCARKTFWSLVIVHVMLIVEVRESQTIPCVRCSSLQISYDFGFLFVCCCCWFCFCLVGFFFCFFLGGGGVWLGIVGVVAMLLVMTLAGLPSVFVERTISLSSV